ncbi:MAG: hypothetical protein R3C56_35730 [Pirellulaceae bacterium]
MVGAVDLTFFHEGRLVGKTRSSEDGAFSVAGLQPAVHSVFAVGAAGHTAFAFEVLPAPDNEPPLAQHLSGKTHFVAANMAARWPVRLVVRVHHSSTVDGSSSRTQCIPSYPAMQSSASGLAGGPLGAPIGGLPGASAGAGTPGNPSATSSFGGGMGGGGMGGGGMGGGGMGSGIGGMGGLGGLLGIAGLAVGVSSISNNDDGFTTPPVTPVSPPIASN